jgi:hypothetical protein
MFHSSFFSMPGLSLPELDEGSLSISELTA